MIVKVAAGDSITLALANDGHVYGWGQFRVSKIPTTILVSEAKVPVCRVAMVYLAFTKILWDRLRSRNRRVCTPSSTT